MTDEKRRSHIYPIEVECPTCGVRRGVACRTAGGNHRHAHDPRIQAAWVATRQAITEQRLQYEALKALREQAAVYAEEDAESTYDEGKGPGTLVHFACGLPDDRIAEAVQEVFDLRPAAIVAALDLQRPIYSSLTCYGHFGRGLPAMTWEKTNRADELAKRVRG